MFFFLNNSVKCLNQDLGKITELLDFSFYPTPYRHNIINVSKISNNAMAITQPVVVN